MAEKNEMPELEAVTEKEETFNHDEHMDKVEEGLNAILASNDIDEIKNIAKGLLNEEKKEKEIEGDKKDVPAETEKVSMEEYLGGK